MRFLLFFFVFFSFNDGVLKDAQPDMFTDDVSFLFYQAVVNFLRSAAGNKAHTLHALAGSVLDRIVAAAGVYFNLFILFIVLYIFH